MVRGYDNIIVGLPIIFVGLFVGIGYREQLRKGIYDLIPDKVDKLDLDSAIRFLHKKRKSIPEIIEYLRQKRGVGGDEISNLIAKHFTEESIRRALKKIN